MQLFIVLSEELQGYMFRTLGGHHQLCLFLKGKYLEEYMVVNMKMGTEKVG
jgi:hypothetical protein